MQLEQGGGGISSEISARSAGGQIEKGVEECGEKRRTSEEGRVKLHIGRTTTKYLPRATI